MNAGLLNMWRENGANLRFGETKNLIVFGVSTALIADFLHRSQPDALPRWSFQAIGSVMIQSPYHALITLALGLSILVSVLSVFPNISGRYLRVRLVLRACRGLRIIRREPNLERTVYFVDIAAYPAPDGYAAALKSNGVTATDWSRAERDLIEQIWVVSRIATVKFVLFSLSMILTLLAGLVIFFNRAI